MLAHAIPNAINVRDLVANQQFVSHSSNHFFNVLIRSSNENAALLLYLILSLNKVVIKLVDELVALTKRFDVPLSATVALCLDHIFALLRLDHSHLESLALNICLVNFACPFLW